MSDRLDRFEMKFAISAEQRDLLMERLGPLLRADCNSGPGARYPVVSLYYDNDSRDCYWEKARGLPSRRKLRVRVYGSRDGAVPPASFVEIKHKCDGRGVKRRMALPLAQALAVCGGRQPEDHPATGESERRILAEVHDLVLQRGFRPALLMRYDRTAFASSDPESDLRITFDDKIHARFDNLTPEPDDRRFKAGDEMRGGDSTVMEVKATGCVPYWLSRVFAETGCRMQSHSKYSAALEQRDPVLRAMLAPKWIERNPLPPVARHTDSVHAVPSAPAVALG